MKKVKWFEGSFNFNVNCNKNINCSFRLFRLSQFVTAIHHIFILLFCINTLSAQTDSLLTTIPIQGKYISTDQLGHAYVITNDNDVVKFKSTGEEVFRFSDNTFGNIEMMDASNPMQIILYYADYLLVRTLDRTMNVSGQYDLSNLNFLMPPVVCASNDNNIWVFDSDNQQLLKVNRDAKILFKSNDLRLLRKQFMQVQKMQNQDDKLYLLDSEKGILVFNLFGRYLETIDIKGIEDFQIIKNQLFYKKENVFHQFNLQTKQHLSRNIAKECMIRIQQDKIYILQADCLEIKSAN